MKTKISIIFCFFAIFSLSGFAQQSPNVISNKVVLAKGDLAPDFTLKDHKGKTVKLSKIVKKSPVVLLFYRGFW